MIRSRAEHRREATISRLVSGVSAASIAFAATASFAGDPVVIEEEAAPEVVARSPRSGWIVPVVVALVLICALARGSDDEPAPTTDD